MEGATTAATDLGLGTIAPGVGALLQVLAASISARAVVEIGTGAGVSGLWLLAGMRPDGVLTTVDVDGDHQRLARRAFTDAGIAPARTRTITGRALEVLPRLTDAAYDIVFIDGDLTELPDYVEEARRLLRPGGLIVIDHALYGNRVADPARRDAVTTTVRGVVAALRDDETLVSTLLPVGDGILVAVTP